MLGPVCAKPADNLLRIPSRSLRLARVDELRIEKPCRARTYLRTGVGYVNLFPPRRLLHLCDMLPPILAMHYFGLGEIPHGKAVALRPESSAPPCGWIRFVAAHRPRLVHSIDILVSTLMRCLRRHAIHVSETGYETDSMSNLPISATGCEEDVAVPRRIDNLLRKDGLRTLLGLEHDAKHPVAVLYHIDAP